eukprot:gene3547-6282_t
MKLPDLKAIEDVVSQLQPLKTHLKPNYGETQFRIKESRSHANGNYFFELKSTSPDQKYTMENPSKLIDFYTSKLYSATEKSEVGYYLHQRGCVYFDTYEYELCENDFKESLKYNPNNSLLYFDYCDLCCIFKKFEEGLIYGMKSIEINPNFPTVYISLAACYNAMESYENSLKYCNEAIKLDPYYIGGYYEIAFTYRHKLKDVESSFSYFTFAIDVSKLLAVIDDKMALSISYRSRGSIYFERDETELGLKDLEMAILFDPESAGNWFQRGYWYFHLEKYSESIDDFSRAIEKMSSREISPWKFYWRGYSYFQLNKLNEAIDDFLICVDLDNSVDWFYYRIGIAYHIQGNLQEAIKYYDKCMELNQSWCGNRNIVLCSSTLMRSIFDMNTSEIL